jgi:hypothetical protein
MKLKVFLKYLLIVMFAIWLMFLCAILFSSCVATKSNGVVARKQKIIYKITPVNKDGAKEGYIIAW